MDSRSVRRLKTAMTYIASLPQRLFSKVSITAVVSNSTIDKTAALDRCVRFYSSDLGRYSYIGAGSYVEHTIIGSFCSISGDCRIGGASHPTGRVSTSPVFCSGGNILKVNFAQGKFDPFKKTVIGHDVWIGNGAIVLSGVMIGNGSVVGAGSVVTKNIPPYEIWAGNPARFIRLRFPEEVSEKINATEWWDWSIEKLQQKDKWFESSCGDNFD